MENLANITDEEFRRIVTTVNTLSNIDLTILQPIILRHRFARYMNKHGYTSASTIIDKLLIDKSFVKSFTTELWVHTTEMFRDTEMWTELDTIFKQRLSGETVVKIWVPDVCGDDELTTLLVLLANNKMIQKSMIYATSPYQSILDECKYGNIEPKKYEISDANYKRIYPTNSLEQYTKKQEKTFRFSQELLENVIFLKQNIIKDTPPDKGFNLILFRNRALYYINQVRKNSIEKLIQSIMPGGYLIIGANENLNGTDQDGMMFKVSKAENIYKKKQ